MYSIITAANNSFKVNFPKDQFCENKKKVTYVNFKIYIWFLMYVLSYINER